MHGRHSSNDADAGCIQIIDPTSFHSDFNHLLLSGHPQYKCSIVPQSNCENHYLTIGETVSCDRDEYYFETEDDGCEGTDYNCSTHIMVQVISSNGISLHRMDSNYTGSMEFNGFDRINIHYLTCRGTFLKFRLPLTGEAFLTNTFIERDI